MPATSGDDVPEFPVYEKNGNTQIAATPQREVELQFDGWRKQEVKAPEPPADPTPKKSPTK